MRGSVEWVPLVGDGRIWLLLIDDSAAGVVCSVPYRGMCAAVADLRTIRVLSAVHGSMIDAALSVELATGARPR